MDFMSNAVVMCIQMDALQQQMWHQNQFMLTGHQTRFPSQKLYDGKDYQSYRDYRGKKRWAPKESQNDKYYSVQEIEPEKQFESLEIIDCRDEHTIAFARCRETDDCFQIECEIPRNTITDKEFFDWLYNQISIACASTKAKSVKLIIGKNDVIATKVFKKLKLFT